ncbi:MAG TPA: DHA2 family efflux MFS transporter permease subunit [Burkholderiales bacterium]|jgi:DHA2 family multidrug resistance protein
MSDTTANAEAGADRPGNPAPPQAARPAPAAASTAQAPLTGGTLILGTISLALATFMNVLDTSIANVSIPAMSGDLGVSTSQGTWVITSFAVANAISLPLTGWLTLRLGQVRLFTLSTLLFVVASLMCGLAPNLPTLILFRVIQGAVAGPMIPLSQTLLMASYSKARVGTALALWSMTTLVAPVVGPLLGGWITDNINWPWIFYINIPVGLFAAGITWMIYKDRETPTKKLPVDGIGLILLVLWVGSLQVMLDKGKELDWFASGTIITLAIVAVVGFVVFLIWEMTDEHPAVDLTLFAKRNFTSGTLSLSLAYAIFFGNLVLLPLWLQQTMGYTATSAGLALAPVGILAIVLMPLVGKNINRVDPRIFASFSFVIFALVFWMRSRFSTDVSIMDVMIPTLVQGIAMAFFFVPLINLALSGLSPERIPAASGLTNFVRITAGAFGTSIYTTLWEDRAAMHHAQLAESINSGSEATTRAVDGLMAQGMSHEQAMGAINNMIDRQVLTLSAAELFYISAFIFIAMIAVIWIAKPARNGAAVDAGAAH